MAEDPAVIRSLATVYASEWSEPVAELLFAPEGFGTVFTLDDADELVAPYLDEALAEALLPLCLVDEGSIACVAIGDEIEGLGARVGRPPAPRRRGRPGGPAAPPRRRPRPLHQLAGDGVGGSEGRVRSRARRDRPRLRGELSGGGEATAGLHRPAGADRLPERDRRPRRDRARQQFRRSLRACLADLRGPARRRARGEPGAGRADPCRCLQERRDDGDPLRPTGRSRPRRGGADLPRAPRGGRPGEPVPLRAHGRRRARRGGSRLDLPDRGARPLPRDHPDASVAARAGRRCDRAARHHPGAGLLHPALPGLARARARLPPGVLGPGRLDPRGRRGLALA